MKVFCPSSCRVFLLCVFFGTTSLSRSAPQLSNGNSTYLLEPVDARTNAKYNSDLSSDQPVEDDKLQTRSYIKVPTERPQVDKTKIMSMMDNVFTYPRHHLTNRTLKEAAKKYISRKFNEYKLETGIQIFEARQLDLKSGTALPLGNNIIGIWPGELWGTSRDKIILIGAHWDTTKFSPGFDDNGSGLAVMLEVARSLTSSSCKPRYSVIFVAFDYEETGCQGSMEFIKSYLTPFILEAHGWPIFQGAIILDSIANYNTSSYSQDLPPEWREVLPGFQQKLQANHFKGDFLAAIYRRDPDRKLASVFSRHWSSGGDPVHIVNGDGHPPPQLSPYSVIGSLKIPGGIITADKINKEILESQEQEKTRFEDLQEQAKPKDDLVEDMIMEPLGDTDMLVDIDKEPEESVLMFRQNVTTTEEPHVDALTEASNIKEDSMVDDEPDTEDSPADENEGSTDIPTKKDKNLQEIFDTESVPNNEDESVEPETDKYVRIVRQVLQKTSEEPMKKSIVDYIEARGFKLNLLTLDLPDKLPHVAVLARYVDFLRSDHARFWFLNDTSLPDESFPAILLTDTGPYRGIMQKCYHYTCDSAANNEEVHFANADFLAKTAQTLANVIVELTEAQCIPSKWHGAEFKLYHSEVTANPEPFKAALRF